MHGEALRLGCHDAVHQWMRHLRYWEEPFGTSKTCTHHVSGARWPAGNSLTRTCPRSALLDHLVPDALPPYTPKTPVAPFCRLLAPTSKNVVEAHNWFVHGTLRGELVSRSVPTAVTLFPCPPALQDGVEEHNWLQHNLGAFVHTIGNPAGGVTQSGELFVEVGLGGVVAKSVSWCCQVEIYPAPERRLGETLVT